MFILISKPIFINKEDKIKIRFFFLILKKKLMRKLYKQNLLQEYSSFYNKTNNKNTNQNLTNTQSSLKGVEKKPFKKSIFLFENFNKLKNITNILTRFFNKSIELELVRIYYPYYNSAILVDLIGTYINKIKLRRIINKFIGKVVSSGPKKIFSLNKKSLPSQLSGIKIRVAGRLLTQRVVPRKTVKIISRGALSNTKAMLVETARFTNKNKRGAYSVTISIGHKLRNS